MWNADLKINGSSERRRPTPHPGGGGFCSNCGSTGWVPFISRWNMKISCRKCSDSRTLLPCLCGCGALKRSPLVEPGTPTWHELRDDSVSRMLATKTGVPA